MARPRGTITQHRGYWRVRLVVRGERRSLGLYPTRDAAERALAAALEHLGDIGAVTLHSFARKWLDERELNGRHRDIDGDRSRWRAHVEPEPWAHVPIDALKARDLRAWTDRLLRTKAKQTVANALNLVRQCLRSAAEAEHVDRNVAAEVKLPRIASARQSWTYLAPDEIRAVLTCETIPERARLIYAVAIYTGLRAGELWGLRWRDVHLDGDRPHLTVCRSYDGPTKGGVPREVELIDAARTALRRWRELSPGVGAALVWPDADGGVHAPGYDAGWADGYGPVRDPVTGRYPRRQGHARLAGIARRVRLHDLRHTCASHLIQGTWGRAWSLEEVQGQLGHQSRVTTERYVHHAPGGRQAAARATTGGHAPARDTTRDTGHTSRIRRSTDPERSR